MRLVVSTHNAGKIAELQALFASGQGELAALSLASLSDFGIPDDVVEDGATFADNARKKACAARARTGQWALSDDSGLEVDALSGAPGVLSARYGGAPRSDARNMEALLAALRPFPDGSRRGRFRCCLCLLAGEVEILCSGAVEGTLLFAPRGDGGFGYDPLFVPLPEEIAAAGLPPERAGLTFAELSAAEKNRLSHRARALSRLQPLLQALLSFASARGA